MKLAQLFEFLLVFTIISFAASRTIESKAVRPAHKHGKVKYKNRQDSANRFCNCSTKLCKCCGNFSVPVMNVKGPGCATLRYQRGDRLGLLLSFGERVITNTTIQGRRPDPVCLPLPSGISKFCGRVYNIGREGEDFFACLGFELRSLQDIEASLRVSCFRFGPKGLRLEPAQPLPALPIEEDDDDDDDEDEYDFDDDDDDEGDEKDNDLDSVDYGTFALDDDFVGNLFVESDNKKKPVKKVVTTTRAPVRVYKKTRKPTIATTTKIVRKRPVKTTAKPAKTTATSTTTEATKPTTIPSKQEVTTIPFKQEVTTIPSKQEVTTFAPKQEVTTFAPKQEVTTVSSKKEVTAIPTTLEMKTSTTAQTTLSTTTEGNTKVFESVPLITHESIASVSTMLQDLPKEPIVVNTKKVNKKPPTTFENIIYRDPVTQVTKKITTSTTQTAPTTKPSIETTKKVVTINEFIAQSTDAPQKLSTFSQIQNEIKKTETNTETVAPIKLETASTEKQVEDSSQDSTTTMEDAETTTALNEENTEMSNKIADEEDIMKSDRKSSITVDEKKKKKKNDDDDDEDDDDLLDDDDDSEEDKSEEDEDDDDDPISPISSVVSDVFGDDDDDDDKKPAEKKKNVTQKKQTKNKESNGFIDDIVDGVMDSIKPDGHDRSSRNAKFMRF